MPKTIACPQCRQPVEESARQCPACGVDVAFASLLAERQVLTQLPDAGNPPLAAERLVPRLGDFLLSSGLITAEQLDAALKRQAELARQGQTRALGQTLVEMGALSRQALDQALTLQIQRLQSELLNSNRQLEQRVRERTAQLQRALDRLKDLNELKNNFVSNVSHELRTPLAQIKGYVALLQDGTLGELNPEQADAVGVTAHATERLERLINDLIEFSVSARGELSLNFQPVSLQQICETLRPSAASKAGKGRLSIEFDVPQDLPPVWADREKLSWVLFQLLDNAIKFTPEGGSVNLAVRHLDEQVHVGVRDTGIGIPEDRLPELFEPFHQLDGSATRRYGGTGLGLALVKRIMDSHKVKIHARSQEGHGSTFYFALSTVPPPAAQA